MLGNKNKSNSSHEGNIQHIYIYIYADECNCLENSVGAKISDFERTCLLTLSYKFVLIVPTARVGAGSDPLLVV